MKKNIIITEQDINNIILQTLNEMAQNSRWIESYIKILQSLNNNTDSNRYISDLYGLLYDNQRYFTTRDLAGIIKSHILSPKNSDSSINLFASEDEVYQTVNPYFVMSFIGINADEMINSAIKARKNKGKNLTDDKITKLSNSVIRDITIIDNNKKELLEYVKENSNSINYVKLQELSCKLYRSCYHLVANVYGIKDSGDLTSQSNHSYEDNYDIKDDSVNIGDEPNPFPLLNGLTQTVKKIYKIYGDNTPNYSHFVKDAIDWVNNNEYIIKQKFNDILVKYREKTSVKDTEFLGMTKGVRFALLALYLGRYIPEMVNRIKNAYKIDTSGWTGFITELEKVNNGINDWDTLDRLTHKIVQIEDKDKIGKKDIYIRNVLYKLIRNNLKNSSSITYDDYISELMDIFKGRDIEQGENKSRTFAINYGFSNGREPKKVDVYSYWQFYQYYFDELGGYLGGDFNNLKHFLMQKLGQLKNKKQSIPLIQYIYSIFFDKYKDLQNIFKTQKIKQDNEKYTIRKNLFKKINAEINDSINKLNNGEIKRFSKIKKDNNNAETVNNNINIAESKIKQIIYETIKRYLK